MKTPANEEMIDTAVTDAEGALDVGYRLPELATKSAIDAAVNRGHKTTHQATQSAIDTGIKVAVLEERVKWLEVDRARLSNEVEAWKNLWVSTITEGRGGVPLVERF